MRSLTKSLISFSWASSLFGLKQLTSMIDPRNMRGQGADTAAALEAVTQSAEEQLGEPLRQVFRTGDALQRQWVDTMLGSLPIPPGPRPGVPAAAPVPPGAAAAPRTAALSDHAVVTRNAAGTLRFVKDGSELVFEGLATTPEGRPDGRYELVFDTAYLAEPQNPNRWLMWFDLPERPYYDPFTESKKTSPLDARAEATLTWTAADGSTITAKGPAVLNLTRYKDGANFFVQSVAANITGGSGRFKGAVGSATSLGNANFLIDQPLQPNTDYPCAVAVSFSHTRRSQIEIPPSSWDYELKTIEVDGPGGKTFDMSYVEVGQGDPIVFLHGNPNWSYTWRNIFPYMQEVGTCYSPDLIGMGPDPSPGTASFSLQDQIQFVENFIEKKGLKNITFFIHDWGSAIGFDYASRHEDNTRALIFMEAVYKSYSSWATFPEPDAPELVRQNFQTFRKGYPSKDSVGYKAIVDDNVFINVLTPSITGRAVTEEEMYWLGKPYQSKVNREIIWRWVNVIPVEGQPPAVAALVDRYNKWLLQTDLPKLLLFTVPGMIVTADSVRYLEQNLKNLHSVNVGSGLHYPQETNPHLVGTESVKWFRNLPRLDKEIKP